MAMLLLNAQRTSGPDVSRLIHNFGVLMKSLPMNGPTLTRGGTVVAGPVWSITPSRDTIEHHNASVPVRYCRRDSEPQCLSLQKQRIATVVLSTRSDLSDGLAQVWPISPAICALLSIRAIVSRPLFQCLRQREALACFAPVAPNQASPADILEVPSTHPDKWS